MSSKILPDATDFRVHEGRYIAFKGPFGFMLDAHGHPFACSATTAESAIREAEKVITAEEFDAEAKRRRGKANYY